MVLNARKDGGREERRSMARTCCREVEAAEGVIAQDSGDEKAPRDTFNKPSSIYVVPSISQSQLCLSCLALVLAYKVYQPGEDENKVARRRLTSWPVVWKSPRNATGSKERKNEIDGNEWNSHDLEPKPPSPSPCMVSICYVGKVMIR
jgi:hypothetical protein